MSDEPRQASLRRLRDFGIRPNRELGQNFLIDDNILRVIGAPPSSTPATWCSRWAAGSACCPSTWRRAVAHLHVVEVDRSLEPPLREALEPFGNATLHLADAVELDFAALEPTPDEGRREPALRRRGHRAAQVDRRAAGGAVCGWRWSSARWVSGSRRRPAARATGRPRCSRSSHARSASCARSRARVFHPEPNVDSALVVLRRHAAAPRRWAGRARARRLRAPAQGARRLARARRRARPTASATPPARALERARPPGRRPRRAAPAGGLAPPGRGDRPRAAGGAPASLGRGRAAQRASVALASRCAERAYAKLNLVLHVGRPRADGLHPICSLFASIELADELTATARESGDDSVDCAGRDGRQPRRPGARGVPRARRRPTCRRSRVRIDKRIPVAAGLGGGSADAAAALRIANRLAGAPLDAAELRGSPPGSARTCPARSSPRHALVQGVGELVEPIELPAARRRAGAGRAGLSTAAVYAELDRLGRRPRPPRPRAAARGSPAPDRPRSPPALENDLEPAALSLRPELAGGSTRSARRGALGAAVSGSGPTCFGLFEDRARGRGGRGGDSTGALVRLASCADVPYSSTCQPGRSSLRWPPCWSRRSWCGAGGGSSSSARRSASAIALALGVYASGVLSRAARPEGGDRGHRARRSGPGRTRSWA